MKSTLFYASTENIDLKSNSFLQFKWLIKNESSTTNKGALNIVVTLDCTFYGGGG